MEIEDGEMDEQRSVTICVNLLIQLRNVTLNDFSKICQVLVFPTPPLSALFGKNHPVSHPVDSLRNILHYINWSGC